MSLFVLLLYFMLLTPAWGAWGSIGAALSSGCNQKSAGTSIGCSLSATVEVGNVIVVISAWDNTGTTDGNLGQLVCSDTVGNVYSEPIEFTNGQGTASNGATTVICHAKVTTELTISSTSMNVDSSGSVTAKAISAWEFTVAAGNVVSVEGAAQTAANDATDPSSLAISGLVNREHLCVRALASEDNAPDVTVTNTASYTAFTESGTDGGGSATNMTINGEFIITTATSCTSDPATAADVDSASAFVALNEDPPPAASTVKMPRVYGPF